jgi:hypothetical protein
MQLYDTARSYDPLVALEAAPQGPAAQVTLERLLEIRDPHLVSLQLHPDLATSSNIEAIRSSGKLVAADAFRFGTEHRWAIWPFQRVAFCSDLYRRGIGVVITNVPESCAEQRDMTRATALEFRLAR